MFMLNVDTIVFDNPIGTLSHFVRETTFRLGIGFLYSHFLIMPVVLPSIMFSFP
jgi:hypothetical protein